MTEKIEDIAKSIKRHRELEISIEATNNAVGRSKTIYNDEEQQFWLTNKENTGGIRYSEDITGARVGTESGNRTTIKEDGKPIYKNTRLGEILILNHEGIHEVEVPAGKIEIEIFNRATYNPIIDGEYATDIQIKLAGDSRTHSFQDIVKILSLQIKIDELEKQKETVTDEEANKLIQRIEEKEREKENYLAKAQSFIRKYAELRYQPILDPIQESIKRSNIFEGALIINGGPGTGKTTSLIQRIKFLISTTIEEYRPLTTPQKDILFNQTKSWIFYSPNELLALFLRNSMKLEELTADSDRVKVWPSQKNELVKIYRFVNTETKRPFLVYNKAKGKNLFTNTSQSIKTIIKDLKNYYINYQKEKLNRVVEIDIDPFKWKNKGKSIQKFINGSQYIKDVEELIRIFLNLNEIYQKDSEENAKEYSKLVKRVASRIHVVIQKDSERAAVISDVLKKWKTEIQEDDEAEDEDTEIEQEDFEEKGEQAAFDFEKELFNKLKSLCRKQALKKFDKNTRLTKRDRELLKLIPEASNQNEYEPLGQAAYFKKYFERIIKGIGANILSEIPIIYKKFRREQLNANSSNWDLTILKELVKKDNNTRIHSNEQALLLSFVNGIAYSLSKSFPAQFNAINHPYITGFKTHCKPVIGIDEATDFSIIDLIAMNSLGHPELSSVTFSGDIMQRMTKEGLNSWNDIKELLPNTEQKDLKVSYRQSPTLLSLAATIYEKSTGQIASYKSYIERDETEPKPLMLISNIEDEKISWIADRILEIYKAYGDSIPSIAIFLPDENQLEQFANKLGDLDTLADVGILVKACRNGEVLGDKNTVRVFSVNVIKGLEFESVFFHNIDELQSQNLPEELLLKYLYVGLSRATFYLGLTVSNEINKDISFLADNFDRTGKTWKL